MRELQRQLCIAAKRNRERRFHAWAERIRRSDVPLEALGTIAILEACMPHEKTIGKPDAGNPHVRFERGPQETEPARTAPEVYLWTSLNSAPAVGPSRTT